MSAHPLQQRPPGFTYRDKKTRQEGSHRELHADAVSLARLAERFGTPLYVYSETTIRERYRLFEQAFKGCEHTICYSVKANSNLSILRVLARMGAGFDIVSGGELQRVVKAAAKSPALAERRLERGTGQEQVPRLPFAALRVARDDRTGHPWQGDRLLRCRQAGGGDRSGFGGWDSAVQRGERERAEAAGGARGASSQEGEVRHSRESPCRRGNASVHFDWPARAQVRRSLARCTGALSSRSEGKFSGAGGRQCTYRLANHGGRPVSRGDAAHRVAGGVAARAAASTFATSTPAADWGSSTIAAQASTSPVT